MYPELLGEEVVSSSPTGTFRRVRRWLRGKHPELGQITWGYTGWETLVEVDSIRPSFIYKVSDEQKVAEEPGV